MILKEDDDRDLKRQQSLRTVENVLIVLLKFATTAIALLFYSMRGQ